MKLTNRRKQFLQKLIDLYESSNLPVHYETLAKVIGVSKWTSYDMLKQLEKMNMVKKEYIVNRHETGRSQIVYSPSEEAYRLFQNISGKELSEQEWEQRKEELIGILKSHSDHQTLTNISQQISKRIPTIDNQLELCANVIAMLVSYLKYSHHSLFDQISELIGHLETDSSKITLFTGTVVGLFLKETNDLGIDVMSMVSEHVNIFDDLSKNESQKLAVFLLEALSV